MGLLDQGISALSTSVGHLSVLLYGKWGTGKTTAAATMPRPICFMSTEPQGALAVKDQAIRMGADPNDIRIYFIQDKLDANGNLLKDESGEELTAQRYMYTLLNELERDPKDFKSVVLDSITAAQDALVDEYKGVRDGKTRQVSQKDWGNIIDDTKQLCKRLRDLKMHTCIVALATDLQDDENRVIYRPNLVGKKLPHDVPQYFNVVGFTRKVLDHDGGERYFVMTRSSSGIIDTKSHQALETEEEPNIALWIEKISNYWDERAQGKLPSESGITHVAPPPPEPPRWQAILDNPDIAAMFDKLDATPAKRKSAAEKYQDDPEKLIEVLKKRIAEAEKEGN